MADTDGARSPFWSPDSRWIGFFAGGRLKKIEAEGGSAQTLANAPVDRGGAWSRSGVIVFAPEHDEPLQQIPESGGEPKPVTSLDLVHGENSHRWPYFLPDGRHFLYLTAFNGEPEKQGIYAGSLNSGEKVRLVISNGAQRMRDLRRSGACCFCVALF